MSQRASKPMIFSTFRSAPSFRQLASADDITRGGPMPLLPGSPMNGVFLEYSANGQRNDLLDVVAAFPRHFLPHLPMLRKIQLLDLQFPTPRALMSMPRKYGNVDATQEHQCMHKFEPVNAPASSPNAAQIGLLSEVSFLVPTQSRQSSPALILDIDIDRQKDRPRTDFVHSYLPRGNAIYDAMRAAQILVSNNEPKQQVPSSRGRANDSSTQWLAIADNISRVRPMPQRKGHSMNLLDLVYSNLRCFVLKRINVSWTRPVLWRLGSPMLNVQLLDLHLPTLRKSVNIDALQDHQCDATQVHQCALDSIKASATGQTNATATGQFNCSLNVQPPGASQVPHRNSRSRSILQYHEHLMLNIQLRDLDLLMP
ncbi:hypothetical protein EV714DRAFT_269813 [Schizophyllum commune]